ncbi:hypothetical protein LCGC14_1657940 [marine sediment metagenome]|uniref:Uncharacterized protein n=1 Tax=marine sediment metagenome TaxID=412755 RepID=A0A0F9HUY4_9ZZZZ
MEPLEFFDAVRDALGQTESTDPTGCDYFIADMEKLFEEWKEVIGIHNKRRNI